ncbi:hypothetical protein ACFQV2_38690 [Actinokineospora soli]|uniref:LytR cell envelope-related transcriptional attenuator n=1 Tax=Actinokineospora soli TaxID=1048753 RepID=A0ABW2U0E2_9PSEU
MIDLAAARRKRGRMAAWGVGVLTAAAAAVAVAFVGLPKTEPGAGGVAAPATTTTQAPSAQPPVALTREDIGQSLNKVVDVKEYGPLGDKAGLDRCLDANGFDPATAQVVGVRPVTLDGEDGVMALLLTQKVGQFRVLVVTPECKALFNDTIN